jgi:Zn-finger nucleic acid-binding protein
MACPACPTQALRVTDRHGIEIDYCPQCRGVWLDRGELDKLIERATAAAPRDYSRDDDDDEYRGRWDTSGRPESRPSGKRRKSFWDELFDFD